MPSNIGNKKCEDIKQPIFYQSETKKELPISAFLIKDSNGNDITPHCKCFSSPQGLIISLDKTFEVPLIVTLLKPNEFKP